MSGPREAEELRLRFIGDAVLRRRADPVTEFGEALTRHVPRMIEIMREEGGVGLAAPQAGISSHFFILIANVDDDEREEDQIQVMANVRIVESSKQEVAIEEGCLSVPGLRFDVDRPERIRIAFHDEDGNPVELETAGYLARVIQHEFDHCEGVLFIDRLSPAKRAVLKRQIAAIEAEHSRDR